MRFFNTAGPINCQDHYCISPLQRFDLDKILGLIADRLRNGRASAHLFADRRQFG